MNYHHFDYGAYKDISSKSNEDLLKEIIRFSDEILNSYTKKFVDNCAKHISQELELTEKERYYIYLIDIRLFCISLLDKLGYINKDNSKNYNKYLGFDLSKKNNYNIIEPSGII